MDKLDFMKQFVFEKTAVENSPGVNDFLTNPESIESGPGKGINFEPTIPSPFKHMPVKDPYSEKGRDDDMGQSGPRKGISEAIDYALPTMNNWAADNYPGLKKDVLDTVDTKTDEIIGKGEKFRDESLGAVDSRVADIKKQLLYGGGGGIAGAVAGGGLSLLLGKLSGNQSLTRDIIGMLAGGGVGAGYGLYKADPEGFKNMFKSASVNPEMLNVEEVALYKTAQHKRSMYIKSPEVYKMYSVFEVDDPALAGMARQRSQELHNR